MGKPATGKLAKAAAVKKEPKSKAKAKVKASPKKAPKAATVKVEPADPGTANFSLSVDRSTLSGLLTSLSYQTKAKKACRTQSSGCQDLGRLQDCRRGRQE